MIHFHNSSYRYELLRITMNVKINYERHNVYNIALDFLTICNRENSPFNSILQTLSRKIAIFVKL